MFWSFQCIGFTLLLLNLFICTLFFLMALSIELVFLYFCSIIASV